MEEIKNEREIPELPFAPIKPGNLVKRFLLIFGPLLVVFGGIVFSIYIFERLNFRNHLKAQERMILEMAGETVWEDLETAVTDLLFLSRLPDLQAFLAHTKYPSNPLLGEFLKYSLRTGRYDEIRLWDGRGGKYFGFLEKEAGPDGGEKEALALGGEEPLWRRILALGAGEILVSAVPLNGKKAGMKAGHFSFAIGTQVRDRNNDVQGCLLLYYTGRDIRHHFETFQEIDSRNIGIFSAEGLALDDSEQGGRGGRRGTEWGSQDLAREKPQVWARICGAEGGQFQENGNLYTFSTIFPWRWVQNPILGKDSNPGPGAFSRDPETFWKLVSFVDAKTLGEKEAKAFRNFVPTSIFILALLLIGSVTLTFSSIARQMSREENRRASKEGLVLANIGRIISLTFHIEDVYERFAAEVRKLIPFDRILITVDNPKEETIQVAYVAGVEVPGFLPGKRITARDGFNENFTKNRAPVLFQPENLEEVERKYPSLVAPFQAGLRSMLSAPLIAEDRVIGILHLRSATSKAYGVRECDLIKRIADQIAGAIANSRLFEELNLAQEALRESEEKFRKIGGAAQDAIIVMDDEGHISFWNSAAEIMFGFSSEEALTRDLHQLIVPARYQKNFAGAFPVFRQAGRGNVMGRLLEFEGIRKGGEEFPLELSLATAKFKDRRHAIGILRDITERKRAEKQIIQAKEESEELNRQLKKACEEANRLSLEAEAANRAKSAFLANMSHEIRTPMNGVVGMTELLLSTPLSAEQRGYAETVQGSADSLLKVIDEILDFSKIEAGKLDLERIDFNLRLTLEKALDLLAVTARAKGLEIACFVKPDVPLLLRGDPFRLRQILINLCGNAIKFTAKGEVAVRVDLEEENDSRVGIRFAVTDTGIGIPKDRIELLFAPFSQGDGSTTRRYGGTGLGLTISKRLAEMMGGRIGAESEEGRGSTFWFTAVLEKRPRNLEEEGEVIIPEDLRGERILIVDDNETNRFILSGHLKSWGCEGDEAADGMEALAKLYKGAKEGNPFRIAVLDMDMPGLDGASLAAKIKGDPHLASLILVLLTATERCGDDDQLHNAGFAACLMKPVKRSQFKDCLRKLLGNPMTDPTPQQAPPPSPAAGKRETKRILLAEDNLTNQKVALGILGKIGYRADVAANGREVLDALKKSSYDLILMDLQMPEMDGFAAAAAIRKGEERNGSHIPIIAMTAHAMRGDREVCLEKGMDDYVPKPVQAKELLEAIERQLGKGDLQRGEAEIPDLADTEEIFEKGMLWDRLGGDAELFEEIIGVFLKDAPLQMGKLREALAKGDSGEVELQAHSLKGAAMNIGGSALQALAYEVENKGKSGDLVGVRPLLSDLEAGFEKLKLAIKRQGVRNPKE